MRNQPILCLLALTLLAAWSGGGCVAPQTPPGFRSDLWHPDEVESVVILRIADLRPEKVAMSDFNRICQNRAKKILKRLNYATLESDLVLPNETVLEEKLRQPDAEWIRSLPETESRWIMLVAVHDVTRKITFGSTGNAEVSVHLFDRKAGLRVWDAKGLGQAGSGGLLGMLEVGMMDENALTLAMEQALSRIPPRSRRPARR